MSDATAPLGPITAVTFTAPDLDEVRAVYGAFLDYRVVADGHVSAAQAEAWDAMAIAGRPMLELAPAVGEDFRFRVIQATPDQYTPFASHGWECR